MSITFREITVENFNDCTELDANDEGRFVAPNVYSIAESKFNTNLQLKAIYNENVMVGFIMYEINKAKKELYIYRLMIDKKYQNKGYGKESLDLIKDISRGRGLERIKLSTSKENVHGIRLYEKSGFIDSKSMKENEEVYVFELD